MMSKTAKELYRMALIKTMPNKAKELYRMMLRREYDIISNKEDCKKPKRYFILLRRPLSNSIKVMFLPF